MLSPSVHDFIYTPLKNLPQPKQSTDTSSPAGCNLFIPYSSCLTGKLTGSEWPIHRRLAVPHMCCTAKAFFLPCDACCLRIRVQSILLSIRAWKVSAKQTPRASFGMAFRLGPPQLRNRVASPHKNQFPVTVQSRPHPPAR
mmetsp:Transcript_58577/g.85861  ORF Transcript_58577/g.85861 Transcript_58577/m.85861 type:complete len:141 (+) Transcript_58577:32-454(+)